MTLKLSITFSIPLAVTCKPSSSSLVFLVNRPIIAVTASSAGIAAPRLDINPDAPPPDIKEPAAPKEELIPEPKPPLKAPIPVPIPAPKLEAAPPRAPPIKPLDIPPPAALPAA